MYSKHSPINSSYKLPARLHDFSLECLLYLLICCLQRYMATASVTYQREIMRLRAALQKADPAALRAMGPPAAVAAGGQQGL
jgi:hypothetical protein